MTVAAAWIDGGWIYSQDPEQDAKYEIHEGWIWGPVGAQKVHTGFYISGGWIWGPSTKLPFVKRQTD